MRRLTVVIALVAAALFAQTSAAHTFKPDGKSLEARAAMQRKVIRHDLQVLRFFDTHRYLLSKGRHAPIARRELRFHRAQLAWTRKELRETLALIRAKQAAARASQLAGMSPVRAIEAVFGDYAGQALTVARCESGLSIWAQNGQYLGLFQMGSNERATYGHGYNAYDQARAAYRYFAASGRDWSPWSCKPW